jgi:hypothetical protein
MKKFLLLALVPGLLLTLSACTEQKKSDPKEAKWTLVWEDVIFFLHLCTIKIPEQ